MLKKFMAVAAVSGLALTSALAQSTAPSSTQTPTAANPAPTSTTSPTAARPMTPSAGTAQFVTKQTTDQWLASKFNGTDVIGSNDEKIGDVSDVLFDKDHKVLAFIVGVGGFLGIGQKDVAIAPASFQAVPGKDASDMKLRLSMTKDELKNAAAFEPYAPPRPVSSQAPATRPTGAPAPTTPPVNKQ